MKLGRFKSSKHKGRYAYVLTPRGIKEKTTLTAKFLRLKLAEFEELRAEIRTLEGEVGFGLDENWFEEDHKHHFLDK